MERQYKYFYVFGHHGETLYELELLLLGNEALASYSCRSHRSLSWTPVTIVLPSSSHYLKELHNKAVEYCALHNFHLSDLLFLNLKAYV